MENLDVNLINTGNININKLDIDNSKIVKATNFKNILISESEI